MIYLVRHGETEFNREGRFQGALDSPLTELGMQQARRMGELLATLAPKDAPIFCSPQGRAKHSAALIREAGGFTSLIGVDPRLREVSIGEWDGRLRSDVDAEFPGFRDHPNYYDWYFKAPGAETFESMTKRLSSWLQDQWLNDKAVIAVSHGVAGRILRGLFANRTKEEMLQLDVPQDACFRLTDGKIQRIQCAPAGV